MGIGSFGFSEMLVIFVIVLIFFGPRRLPEIARSLGHATREFRRSLNQIQRELEEADPRPGLTRRSPPPPPPARPPAASGAAGASEEAGSAERPGSKRGEEGSADEAESPHPSPRDGSAADDEQIPMFFPASGVKGPPSPTDSESG